MTEASTASVRTRVSLRTLSLPWGPASIAMPQGGGSLAQNPSEFQNKVQGSLPLSIFSLASMTCTRTGIDSSRNLVLSLLNQGNNEIK